ncbi:hypothetical protein C8R45DRAFT_942523 [Mycena sanguinolenta]|nr:hypothetical protein C8R45DRAFT_942523 [Mycena sanguinolenta]
MDPPTCPCRHCGQNIKLRGVSSNEKACHKKQMDATQTKAFMQQLHRRQHTCWTLSILYTSAQVIYRRDSFRGCCAANSSSVYLQVVPANTAATRGPDLRFGFNVDANLEEFTIKNCNYMNKQWEAASKKCTNFEKYNVVVPYKETLPSFEMFARPLWSWTLDLIRDPCLASCFVWDAVKMYQHNGTSFVCFLNKPWMADAFWEIQSLLPNHKDAKLCSYIIYANESKLLSFGTQKAYPIIARLGNVVVGIQNGNGWSGDQVIGELPIVTNDAAETKQKGYVKFKNVVWHESLFKLLESITVHSKTVCLVGKDEQSDLTLVSDLQTAQASKAAMEKTRKLTSDAGEELLKDLGLQAPFNNPSSKHEDIAKMMVHPAQNILTGSLGLKLLKCVRVYLELDLLVGLELHNTNTITAGCRQLQTFNKLLKIVCIFKEILGCVHRYRIREQELGFSQSPHAFDDIVQKGVSKNFGTKIDESMHGAVQAAYLRQTNFKDVQPHTLRNTVIGAKQKPISFVALETAKANDTAFTRFRIRFAEFLNVFLPAYRHPLPRGKRVVFVAEQDITPYQFLKIHFKSLKHWLDDTDFLRCNPCFHNWEKYDTALVKTTVGDIFVCLAFVFICEVEVGGKVHPFALVQPLDVRTGPRTAKDKVLGLHRVHQRERKDCEFISVHSIICGAFLAPDFDKRGDYFVVDVVDADMYFRLKAMYPGCAVE